MYLHTRSRLPTKKSLETWTIDWSSHHHLINIPASTLPYKCHSVLRLVRAWCRSACDSHLQPISQSRRDPLLPRVPSCLEISPATRSRESENGQNGMPGCWSPQYAIDETEGLIVPFSTIFIEAESRVRGVATKPKMVYVKTHLHIFLTLTTAHAQKCYDLLLLNPLVWLLSQVFKSLNAMTTSERVFHVSWDYFLLVVNIVSQIFST